MLPSVPIDLLELDYAPPGHVGPASTFVLGVTILGVGIGSLLITMLLRARQLERLQAEQKRILTERAEWPLSDGPNRVVYGQVECEHDGDTAVAVDIVQEVQQESSKNGSWYNWVEVHRKVKATPFYLVHENGERVLVEPGERVLVTDSLETELPPDMPRKRVRTSKVQHGERFYAYGDLHQGAHPRARAAYRGGSVGWILRPPRHRHKMLLATHAIEERYSERIAFLRNWSLIFGVSWMVFQTFAVLPFGALALFGTQTVATDVQTSIRVSAGRKPVRHYVVNAVSVEGVRCEAEVSPATHFVLEGTPDARIPLMHVGSSICRLGMRPTAPALPLVLGVIAALVALIIARKKYKERFAWYDMPALTEFGGQGTWRDERV